MSPSNYKDIRKKNIRRYGIETKHLELLSQLYTDRTHFVYELLQNAEDAGATRIVFLLEKYKLTIRHDGKEFDHSDVEGICGVGDTTKAGDVTKIGRFGIGFKSVFTYSSRPEIRSGAERFAIESFVRPFEINFKEIPDTFTTEFVLNFDQAETRDNAYNEIAGRLERLSTRTLLFLESLEQIAWKHESNIGAFVVVRSEPDKGPTRISLLGEVDGQRTEKESWLVYSKELESEERVKPVQIAWRLNDDETSVAFVEHSRLFVFFPTDVETHLGFVLQGPFVTTPARDNVPINEDWNRRVICQAADLLVESLRSLKENGLLDVAVLQCLPIAPRHLEPDSRFFALAEATREALKEEDLLPGIDGSYVAADKAVLGRSADLRAVISPGQLVRIYKLDTATQWLDGKITENTTPGLRQYLLEELEITEIEGIGFARRVDDEFFEEQSDQWLTQFYGYLSEQPALWRVNKRPYGPLWERKYIRLEDGSHDAPLEEDGTPRVFLPGISTSVSCIKSVFASDDRCNLFFRQLGLAQPDEAAVFVQTVLPLYSTLTHYWNEDSLERWIPIDVEPHLEHIETLLSLLENCEPKRARSLITSCAERCFLLADNDETTEPEFQKPDELYLRSDELEVYFAGISDVGFLSMKYGERGVELAKAFNIDTEVFIWRREPDAQGFVVIANDHGRHVRGVSGFNPMCSVHCLDIVLSEPNLERSLLVWNKFVLLMHDQIRGKVQTATKQTYSNAIESEQYSEFGKTLISHAWLPDKDGEFKRPAEINAEEIDSRFRDVGLVAASLGIKGAELVSLANSLGFDPGDIELFMRLKSNPELYRRVLTLLKSRPEFPVQESSNPGRRKRELKKRIAQAPKVKRESRKRSVRTTANKDQIRSYLAAKYTNGDGELVCQICEDVMPFKKKDDSWYFEAVQLLDNPELELDATSVALCPTCSAKFKEYVQGTDQQKRISELLDNSSNNSIQINLDKGLETIRFTGTHLLDLKTVLENH